MAVKEVVYRGKTIKNIPKGKVQQWFIFNADGNRTLNAVGVRCQAHDTYTEAKKHIDVLWELQGRGKPKRKVEII